jgi:hypothetical protein
MGMKYEPNNTDDEAVHQEAAQIRVAFAFYRLSCSRINLNGNMIGIKEE